MKKLIYGALLTLIAVPAFQSCIDDKESASVTNVRNAKANELNAIASWYESKTANDAAQSAAQVAAAAADKAYREAETAYLQAQTALLEVQAQLQAITVQLQGVELQRAQAELEAQKAFYELQIQQYAAQMEVAKNQLQDAIYAAELAAQNYETALIQAQYDYLVAYNNYLSQLQTNQEDALTRAQALVNYWMNKYNTAADLLADAQSHINSINIQLMGANADTYTDYELSTSTKKQLEEQIETLNTEIANAQAQIEALQEYANYTTDELEAEIQKATVAQMATNQELLAAQKTRQDASATLYGGSTSTGTTVTPGATQALQQSIYYQQGVTPIIQGALYQSVGGQTLGGSDYDTDYSTYQTYIYYWNQPAAEDAEDQTPTQVTLLTLDQAQESVSYTPTQEGLVTETVDYQVYNDYYTYNATGFTSLITYLTGLNTAAQKEAEEALPEGEKLPADWKAPYADLLETITDAWTVLQAQQKTVATLVSNYNDASKAYAEAEIAYNEADLADQEAQGTLQALQDLQNGQNAEALIAQLEEQIEADMEQIEALQNELALLGQSYTDYVALLEQSLEFWQQRLSVAQTMYDAAQKALNNAVDEYAGE